MRLRLQLPPTSDTNSSARMALRSATGRTRLAASGIGIVLVAVAVLVAVGRNDAPAPADFGNRVPGQRIYDQTGLLSSTDLVSLDRRAASIEQSGVPVVVYIRPTGSDASDTESDARALMQSWDVESVPGAADGLVLLLDIDRLDADPDPDHVALIPGDQLKDSRLPIRETERISAGSVQGLATGVDSSQDLAATIDFSLAATERRLLLGLPSAPSPSTAERTAATFARYLMPIVSVVLALLAAIAIGAIWRGRSRPASAARCDAVASDSPVLRAALAANRVDQSVVVAAIRRVAGQGALETWPELASGSDDRLPGRVCLIDRDQAVDEIDRAIWDELAMVSVDGVVDGHGLTLVAHRSGRFSQAITAELERRGWWDTMAPRRAVPLKMMSQGLLVAGGVTLVIALAVGEVWGIFAIAILTLMAAIAWICSLAYPRATPLGLAVAQQPVNVDGTRA